MSPSGPTGSRLLGALPWAGLAALAAALCLQQILSVDYWWLLRAGQLIAETGSVPRSDPFTYTAHGAAWTDIHWLFQLGLWQVYGLAGHAGVVVSKLALVLATLALLAPIGRRPGRACLGAAALGLFLLASVERLMPRPELASWALLAATLALLDRYERRGDAWVWAVVPIQVLWANLHGLFALGTALCAMSLVGELLRPVGDDDEPMRWRRVATLGALAVLAGLAPLANPNGVDGALYPVQQLAMISDASSRGFFGNAIIELEPTFGSMPAGPLLCFLALAGLSGVALFARWREANVADILQWTAFFYLAMGARRNVPLFAIVAAPLFVRHANAWLDARPLRPRSVTWAGVAVSALLALLAVDAARGGLYARMGLIRTPGLGVEWWRFPVGPADWLERHPPTGPVAHAMVDGGYLIWRLHPEVPVMLDGRLEVFGPELFEGLLIGSPERFEALDARYRFGAVLRRHESARAAEFFAYFWEHADWQLAAVDDAAALFVRAPAGGDTGPPPLDVGLPGLFPALDGSHRQRDGRLLRWRTAFFSSVGRDDLALRVWEEALLLFPDLEGGALVRRMLRERLGESPPSGEEADESRPTRSEP